MKTILNIDVEASLLEAAEGYARKHNTDLSSLIEAYFKHLSLSPANKNVVQLVNELKPSPVNAETDLKERHHEEQKVKHGF